MGAFYYQPGSNIYLVVFDVSGTERGRIGAGEGTRTPDRLITNQLLYQLSYASVWQVMHVAAAWYYQGRR